MALKIYFMTSHALLWLATSIRQQARAIKMAALTNRPRCGELSITLHMKVAYEPPITVSRRGAITSSVCTGGFDNDACDLYPIHIGR